LAFFLVNFSILRNAGGNPISKTTYQ